ncbi:ATPase [Aureococcus anophagefferens]|nr:ATPase [Aureococcus anophagefferens]
MSGDDDADGKHNAWLSPEVLALPVHCAARAESGGARKVLLATRRRAWARRQADAAAASDRAVQRRRAAEKRARVEVLLPRCRGALRSAAREGRGQRSQRSRPWTGTLVWEDSARRAKYGRCLVVDEADKAPLEVVCVLKALLEDGELTMSDGRRIVDDDANDELKKPRYDIRGGGEGGAVLDDPDA